MNDKQRELLIYAQGMLDGLIWCVPNDTVEAFSCVLEKLEEILKIEDRKDSLDVLREAAGQISAICNGHKCSNCPLAVDGDCPFSNDLGDPVNPYLWNLTLKKEETK